MGGWVGGWFTYLGAHDGSTEPGQRKLSFLPSLFEAFEPLIGWVGGWVGELRVWVGGWVGG